MPNEPSYVAARVYRLKNLRALQAASDHANRLDATSRLRRRKGADSRLNLRINPWKGDRIENPDAPFNLVEDFKRNKAIRNLAERNNAAPVAHIIFQVSPRWIEEGGDRHDPENPRNKAWFKCGFDWAEQEFGQGSVLSTRMDLDEDGAGTLDVFVCAAAKTKKGRTYLSISPHLKAMQTRYGARKTFAGLQDSVAEYVQTHLDPKICRGNPKEGAAPDRVTPEVFKAREANNRRRKRLEFIRASVKNQHRVLKEGQRALDEHSDDLQRRQIGLEAAQTLFEAEKADFLDAADRDRARLQDERRHFDAQSREKEGALVAREAVLAEREADLKNRARLLLVGEEDLRRRAEGAAKEFAENRQEIEQQRVDLEDREKAFERAKITAREDAEYARIVAREQGLKDAIAGAAGAVAQARAAAIEEGRAEGHAEALRLAARVRPLPLDRVMRALGGERDRENPRRWTLPSLGPVTIDGTTTHRFRVGNPGGSGGGAIDLVKMETGFDFRRAVRFLATEFDVADIEADHAHREAEKAAVAVSASIRSSAICIEDRAPPAPEERVVVSRHLQSCGVDADILERAFDTGSLEATRQGERVMARWTLRNEQDISVGYAIEAIDGAFSTIRGQPGICAFDVDERAYLLESEEGPPQYWVAETPAQAMVALSVARKLELPTSESSVMARVVSGFGADEKVLDAVAARATRDGADVVIGMRNDAAGRGLAGYLGEKLKELGLKSRSMVGILSALKVGSWSQVARRIRENAAAVITTLKVVRDQRLGQSKGQSNKDTSHGLGWER